MASKPRNRKEPLDRRRLRDFLGGWYDSQMTSALRKPRPPEEVRKHGGSVFDIQPEMSSTKAVPVLLELTDILGFEPPKDVIKKGGYKDRDEFVWELSGRVEQAFETYSEGVTENPKQEKEISRHAQL